MLPHLGINESVTRPMGQLGTGYKKHLFHRKSPLIVGASVNIVDVLKGIGIGVSNDRKCSVRYEFLVSETPDGEQKIDGWVLPTFGVFGETLTLQMQDGTSVKFTFVERDGTVLVDGGVSPNLNERSSV
jgi:hypothetical protein